MMLFLSYIFPLLQMITFDVASRIAPCCKVTFGRITCDMRILQATMAPAVECTGPTVIEPSSVRQILCRALRWLRILSMGTSHEESPFASVP
jgi:hypothetical protein